MQELRDPRSESPELREITRPTLLLDEARVRRNIERMSAKAARSGVDFRPHFKTHQSARIGSWFRERQVSKITVSSVKMAEYFAAQGWDDIVIAFPANMREIEAINELAGKARLGLIFDSVDTARFFGEQLRFPVEAWIEIDTGYHRTGIAWDDKGEAANIARAIVSSGLMALRGLLTHAGHTYAARSTDEIRRIYAETAERMAGVRTDLALHGFTGMLLSVGDTPSCSVVDDLSAGGLVDEVRPGNFVFYDLMQAELGSCSVEDIAVAVACPVVAKNAERCQVVVHGGGVHLSKEFMVDRQGKRTYGAVALPASEGLGWGAVLDGAYVSSVSQ